MIGINNMSRIKEIILALAIVVVLNLFFNYGVYTFYKPPVYDKFCPVELMQKQYADPAACEAAGGKWFNGPEELNPKYYQYQTPMPAPVLPGDSKTQRGWCDATAQCRQNFDTVNNVYNRNVFIFLILAGLISLGLGFLVISATPVSNGFLGGGLLSLIVGTVRYWSNMNDYLRFITLGLALAVLIWLGYKKIKN